MSIDLTKAQIDAALPKVATGLKQYQWLQANRDASDLRRNVLYRRRFNTFYRVRRNQAWQNAFYELLEALKLKGKTVSFAEILDSLFKATGRYEASFTSKLLATIKPQMPVIDSVVLRNLRLRLPYAGSKERLNRIQQLHDRLLFCFSTFLETENGRYLVRRFRELYGCSDLTEIKMLDLVLWQTRPKKA